MSTGFAYRIYPLSDFEMWQWWRRSSGVRASSSAPRGRRRSLSPLGAGEGKLLLVAPVHRLIFMNSDPLPGSMPSTGNGKPAVISRMAGAIYF